eukprot:863924-Prymnesium_polylepis.1
MVAMMAVKAEVARAVAVKAAVTLRAGVNLAITTSTPGHDLSDVASVPHTETVFCRRKVWDLRCARPASAGAAARYGATPATPCSQPGGAKEARAPLALPACLRASHVKPPDRAGLGRPPGGDHDQL